METRIGQNDSNTKTQKHRSWWSAVQRHVVSGQMLSGAMILVVISLAAVYFLNGSVVAAVSFHAFPNDSHTFNSATASIYDDEFDGPSLNSRWSWTNEDPSRWSLAISPGNLRIIGTAGDMWQSCNNAKNLLLQPFPSGDFQFSTKLIIHPTINYQEGGLLIFEDMDNYIKLDALWNNTTQGGPSIEFIKEQQGVFDQTWFWISANLNNPVFLKIVKLANSYTGYYSVDGQQWTSLGSKTLPMTTPQMGVFALAPGGNAPPQCGGIPDIPVDFDFFRVTGAYSVSGHVTDDKGNGAPGVTLTASNGNSAITNATGYYTITNLIAGTYTLTPTLSGYRFAPTSISSIGVPPDRTGKDFKIRPAVPDTFLSLPITYTNTSFAAAASEYDNQSQGRVKSWFDHKYPEYDHDNPNKGTGQFVPWWTSQPITQSIYNNCENLASPRGHCYDGHNGIDFTPPSRDASDVAVLAAENGIVVKRFDCPTCTTGYGSYVDISHQNGYITRYGHLAAISDTIQVTTPPTTVSAGQRIGRMGSTGNSTGTHLHFGVYYDANGNGQIDEWEEAVDPYGWRPSNNLADADPWVALTGGGTPSYPLWTQSLVISGTSSLSATVVVTDARGTGIVRVPPGSFGTPLTILLTDQPIANPSAQLRSTGHSFLLQVLEWLSGGKGTNSSRIRTTTGSFLQPVSITVQYGDSVLRHLDLNHLTLYRWNESANTWTGLPTTIDSNIKQATALSAEAGGFDLQAPLICPADSREVDDTFSASNVVATNGTTYSDLLDIAQDEDWFRLNAIGGKKYTLQTSNLAAGVDTFLELYKSDGTTVLASDDNSGGGKASRLVWQAPQDGLYFIRISQAPGSSFGCSAGYQLRVSQEGDVFLPLIRK